MASVKHVMVEATPDEIVKAAFDNNHRKENTLRQYVAQTLRLHAHFFQGSEELKDLRWVKRDCTELIEFLKIAQQTASNPPSIPLEATIVHGVPEAVQVVLGLLQKKLPGDRSRFNGMRPMTKTGWHVMKFRTVGVRTCINGCNHKSNNFSVLSNGAILLYRCLGSECIKKAKRMLGVYFWPECLPLQIDADNSRVLQDCQKYICTSNEKDSEAAAKQEVATLLDIVVKVMNHYFGVVTGSSRITYTETLFKRDLDNSLKPFKKILRSGHEFTERCETLGLSKVPGKVKNAGAYWRSSSARRQYDTVVFYPSLNEGNPKHFNLFNGLIFEPLKSKLTEEGMRECEAKIPKLLWHIRYILANGCELAYKYMICWLAHVIQKPHKKTGVALVMRSKQGSGKSALFDFFGIMIVGVELYLYCQDLENVIGSFNAVAANKLLTVFDEVNSWGGAYKLNNRLKSMITQSQGVLNRKGVDAIQVDDFQNIVFTTNEYWPIKKETDDRRYFAMESSDKMIRNKAYFAALFKELNDVAETPYVFHRYLSSIDISEWNPQDIPQT
ncbi:hypothetical protein KFL_014790010, partial [Klebsormidium nitens]